MVFLSGTFARKESTTPTGKENDDDAQQMLIDIQGHYDKKGAYLEIDAVVFWSYLLNRKPYQQIIKKSKKIRYYDFKKIIKIKNFPYCVLCYYIVYSIYYILYTILIFEFRGGEKAWIFG